MRQPWRAIYYRNYNVCNFSMEVTLMSVTFLKKTSTHYYNVHKDVTRAIGDTLTK